MDSPEQALNRVLEVAQALVSLSGAKPIVVLENAGSPIDVSACQSTPRIGASPCGHPGSVDSRDRIAVPLPPSPKLARLRTAIVGGALLTALSFTSVWYARAYFYPRESAAPVAPMGMRGADFARSLPGEIRTVSRDLPLEGRALLDTIAGSESAYPGRDPYKAIYGGRAAESLTDHPRQHVEIVTGPNIGQKSSAAGRYQYLARSWDEASKALGLPDFSPESQDKAAFWEAQRTYRAKTGRDLVTDIQEANGDPQKLAVIGRGISSWWTSLPGGIEPNKATSSFGDRFAQNLLYYKGLARAPSHLPDSAGAIGPAPSLAAPRPGSGAPAGTQAAPDTNHRIDLKAKAALDVRTTGLPQATTKSNRVPGRATIASQTANAISSPRRRFAAVQASTAEHRTEVPTGFQVEPETRPTTVNGWMVRDVIGGKAILEGPSGIRNVALGDVLPDLGRIDSIIRWGSRWIVSTERGLISTL